VSLPNTADRRPLNSRFIDHFPDFRIYSQYISLHGIHDEKATAAANNDERQKEYIKKDVPENHQASLNTS
jgi:hypothetical protein